MDGLSWGTIHWQEFKWVITCLIIAAPMIHNAIVGRESKRDKRAYLVSGLARPHTFSAADRAMIERTRQILSELEGHVLPVIRGSELLTAVSIMRIQEAELVARIAVKEQALVEVGLLDEPTGVSYFLGNLLMLPFSPTRHRTADELGLIAMRQAYAARDLWEAIQKLRRAIGSVG
jgi:hypothetical protein